MAHIEQDTMSVAVPKATAYASPIGQLPVELALLIIQALVHDLARKDNYLAREVSVLQTVHSLSLIDHHFNDLINDTPSLWARLSAIDPPRLLSKAMQMSKSQPLEIFYEQDNYATRFSQKSTMEAFLRIVAPACDRWRSIDLSIPDEAFNQISDILDLPTPTLQIMIMWLDGPCNDERPPLRPFRWSMNGLKELCVGRIFVDWSGCTFSGLTSLELSNDRHDRSASALQVLEWLTESPDLVSLTLRYVPVNPSINATAFDSIRLPKLTKLTLHHAGFTPELLGSVRMPALKYLDIKDRLDNQPITSLFNNRTSHLYPAILSSLSQTPRPAELVLFNDDAWLTSETFHLRLFAYISYDIFRSTPAAVEPLLSSIPLALEFHGFDILHDGFLQTLTTVTRIQQITLTDDWGAAELFELFATPNADGFPCPELTVLSLDLDTSPLAGAIQAMAESRYGRNPEREGENQNLPAPFRHIHLKVDGWTVGMTSRLRDVVGESCIKWGNFPRLIPEI